MNNLRYSQIFSVLLLSGACAMLSQTVPYSIEGILGAGLATGFQILLCIPLLLLYRTETIFTSKTLLPKIGLWVLAGYLLLRSGDTFAGLYRTITEFSLPISSNTLGLLAIALVCLYTVSCELQALVRSSTILLGLFLLAMLLLLVGAVPKGTTYFLSYAIEDTVWNGFLRWMCHTDTLPLLLLMLYFSRKQVSKKSLLIFLAILLLYSILSLLGLAVLGQGAAQSEHPFFALLAVSQPLSTQRADAIFLLLFVMLYVLRLSLFVGMAAHLLRKLLPRLACTSGICLLIALCIAWIFLRLHVSDYWHLLSFGVVAILLPLLMLWKQRQYRKGASPLCGH